MQAVKRGMGSNSKAVVQHGSMHVCSVSSRLSTAAVVMLPRVPAGNPGMSRSLWRCRGCARQSIACKVSVAQHAIKDQ